MTTRIQTDALKALLRFVAVKDVRYYLIGVNFEPEGYAVATDGHTLMAVRCEPFSGDSFIVPSAAAKAAFSLNKKPPEIAVSREAIGGVAHTPIDGKFPDWRQLVPTAPSGDIARFDADYLARVKAAFRDMGATHLAAAGMSVAHNGNGPALVSVESIDALVLVKPVCQNNFDVAAKAREFLRPLATEALLA